MNHKKIVSHNEVGCYDILVAWVVFELLDVVPACGGGGGGGGGGKPKDSNDGKKPKQNASTTLSKKEKKELKKRKIKEAFDNSLAASWGGFQVPASVTAEWNDWLNKYQDQMSWQQLLLQNLTYPDDADFPENMPHSWKGLGPGHEGFPPNEVPAWAFKAKNTGLPVYCYQALDYGICPTEENMMDNTTSTEAPKGPFPRWAFNSYIEECQEFQFFGCGGNRNNFPDKLQCENACTNPDPSGGGCGLQTGIRYTEGEDGEPIPEIDRRSATRRCDLKQPEI